MGGKKESSQTVSCIGTILNQRGLHARAAAKFVKTAGKFDADITVGKGGQIVSGLSIMGLMMLAAGPGSQIEITASGPDAVPALAAIRSMIEAKFEEE
jgi:phosphocarrier protein